MRALDTDSLLKKEPHLLSFAFQNISWRFRLVPKLYGHLLKSEQLSFFFTIKHQDSFEHLTASAL